MPHILASVQTMNDEDIDVLMAKLKHQLATREVVIGNESWRQIQVWICERVAVRTVSNQILCLNLKFQM